MKSKFLKLSLVAVALGGAVFALRSQPSSPPPARAYDSYGNDGRYRLVVGDGREYVIDTQSGRVWHSALDVDNKMVVLVSFTYENIAGERSTVPNETATGVVVKPKPTATSESSSHK